MNSAELDALFEQLLDVAQKNEQKLFLDQMGEVIGARAIAPDQIDTLMSRLEGVGVHVGGDSEVDLSATLRKVIQTALLLKKSGKPVNAAKIAEQSSLSERAVRVALLYSEVIRRPS